MPRDSKRRSLLRRCCEFSVLLSFAWSVTASGANEGADVPRVVSLAPSLTAILVALGAADILVGIDDVSARQQPSLAGLPKVGGLFSPSLEAVVALQPGLVVLVPAVEQRDLRRRLEALGISVAGFENARFEQVLENIERLGALAGRSREARVRIGEIKKVREELAAASSGRARPRVVVVLQRDPLFVVGSGSFVEEMLRAVGADNVASGFEDAYPRVSLEWLLESAPEVLIDVEPNAGDATRFWSRWPALPAVANGRVLPLEPELVTLPGPGLDAGMQALALAIFGDDAASGGSDAATVREP